MLVTPHVVIIWFTAILISSLAVVIFIGSNRFSSRVFSISILFVAMWTTAVGCFVAARNPVLADYFIKSCFFLGNLLAASFLYFFISFPADKKPSKILLWSLILVQCSLVFFYFFSNLIVYGPRDIPDRTQSMWWGWNLGSWYLLFNLLFFGYFLTGLSILAKRLITASNKIERRRLGSLFVAFIVGLIPPTVSHLVLPVFGHFELNWIGPTSGLIWIPIIAYSIIRYRQMDVEAVTTEVLAIAMTAIFFFNIFIDSPFGILGKIGAFLAFFILAIYLIRGVLREANQRAELKDFNDNLADKVAKQTVEIRASYEAERQARQDLEKLNDAKNQFVVMTQHNLRAPISNINQTISEITEAVERGEPSAVNHNQLKSAAASGKRLTNLVDDFLNISTLKPGANILDIDTTSLRDQMRYIIEESRRILEEGQIRVVWPDRETAWPKIPVDAAKMREVLAIIFENAIRYNEPGGSIEINTSTNDDTFEILVRNTGIGISPEDAGRIGASIFYRSEWARKRYPVGMGVGLSVVRAIIEAHKGTFTISSEGIGTGAIAKVTLPLRFSIRETFTPTSP